MSPLGVSQHRGTQPLCPGKNTWASVSRSTSERVFKKEHLKLTFPVPNHCLFPTGCASCNSEDKLIALRWEIIHCKCFRVLSMTLAEFFVYRSPLWQETFQWKPARRVSKGPRPGAVMEQRNPIAPRSETNVETITFNNLLLV